MKTTKTKVPPFKPEHGAHVMTTRRDDLRRGIVQVPGDKSSKVAWRKGQQTISNASLMPYSKELMDERLKAAMEQKTASKSAIVTFPDREQAEQLAASLIGQGYRAEVKDCTHASAFNPDKPYQVRVYGIHDYDL
ncbi:MAG TPA: hypothetical protein VGB77_13450, partial [Abditibacteriaceae bacterium]